MPTGAKTQKRFSEASRAVQLAAHAASGLLAGASKSQPGFRVRLLEASRLVRAAEGLARMATALLETPTEAADTRPPSSAEAAAEPRSQARAGAQPQAPLPRKKRRRRTKRKKKKEKENEEEMNLEEDVTCGELVHEGAMDVTGLGDETINDEWADVTSGKARIARTRATASSPPPTSSTSGGAPPSPSGSMAPELIAQAGEKSNELTAGAMAFLSRRMSANEEGTMSELKDLSRRLGISPSDKEALAVAYFVEFGMLRPDG